MKWLPFFILLFLASCKAGKRKQPVVEKADLEEEFYEMPFRTETDTGYFRGYPAVFLNNIKETDSSQLARFLSNLISKKDIVLIDSQSLSHSVFIDQQKKIRYDTLRNKQTVLVSEYGFGDYEFQIVKLNGKTIQNYHYKEVDQNWQDILNYDGQSFRHFSFKGKEFFYVQASMMDGTGTSAGNIVYHYLFDEKLNRLAEFNTCRFALPLFGDINGDDRLDYLDFDNSEFCTTVPSSDNVLLQFYSFDKGKFVLQENKKNKPWFIDGRTGDGFRQDSFIVKDYLWPVKLK